VTSPVVVCNTPKVAGPPASVFCCSCPCWMASVSQLTIVVRLNCCWFRQHSHSWLQSPRDPRPRFYCLLDMYLFRNEASSATKEGSVFLYRHYACFTVISAREHPRYDVFQVAVDSVRLSGSEVYVYNLSMDRTEYTAANRSFVVK
jgi:hypothetical protein